MSDEAQAFIDAIDTQKEKEIISIGSSLKICLVAEGEVDIYPRLGHTMEWDTGAGHAIINESGATILKHNSLKNRNINYNKRKLLNDHFIVIADL